MSADEIQQTRQDVNSSLYSWMKREVAHGIPGILVSMEGCIQEVFNTIASESRRDPLPQFTSGEVQETIDFLNVAKFAMQDHVNIFEGVDLQEITDEQLETRLEKARESSCRLAFLIGDSRTDFASVTPALAISESEQATETCSQLSRLQSFFQTFSDGEWRGIVYASEDFIARQSLATRMLEGLLQPSRPELGDTQNTDQLVKSIMNAFVQHSNPTHSGSVQQTTALAQAMRELSSLMQHSSSRGLKH